MIEESITVPTLSAEDGAAAVVGWTKQHNRTRNALSNRIVLSHGTLTGTGAGLSPHLYLYLLSIRRIERVYKVSVFFCYKKGRVDAALLHGHLRRARHNRAFSIIIQSFFTASQDELVALLMGRVSCGRNRPGEASQDVSGRAGPAVTAGREEPHVSTRSLSLPRGRECGTRLRRGTPDAQGREVCRRPAEPPGTPSRFRSGRQLRADPLQPWFGVPVLARMICGNCESCSKNGVRYSVQSGLRSGRIRSGWKNSIATVNGGAVRHSRRWYSVLPTTLRARS